MKNIYKIESLHYLHRTEYIFKNLKLFFKDSILFLYNLDCTRCAKNKYKFSLIPTFERRHFMLLF